MDHDVRSAEIIFLFCFHAILNTFVLSWLSEISMLLVCFIANIMFLLFYVMSVYRDTELSSVN